MGGKKFGLIILAGTVLLTAMGYGSGLLVAGILNNVSDNSRNQVRNKYILKIALDKTVPDDVNIYTPQFYETDMFLAKMYADYFKIDVSPTETEEYYLFANEKELLYVYKFKSMIKYRLNSETEVSVDVEGIKESDALKAAEEFIKSKFLSLNYEDASVNLIDGSYVVKFMNRLGNLKNLGFPNEVIVDNTGQVTALTYYFISYEGLGSIPVRSMNEAFYGLSTDADRVVISSCRMVYIYRDSILQPAYMFQGKTANEEYFESFVEAALYGIDK